MKISGHIVNHDSEFDGEIVINEKTGLIESVSPFLKGSTPEAGGISTEGCLIFPGFTDLHVHAREDTSGKENYKEDFATASAAALHGGVTQFAEMPNNPVPPVDDASYAAKEKLALAHSTIPTLLYAGIGPNTKPLTKKVPYKVYMGPSVGNLFFKSFDELETAIAKYHDQTVTFHCDDPEILKQHENEKTHETKRPVEAEVSAIDFALKLTAKYNLTSKLCHISSKKGIEMIAAAKIHGANVTAEAAPHHMFFDSSMFTEKNHSLLQINPPIRSAEDRLAVIEGLKNGALDYLATDHSPHTMEEKLRRPAGGGAEGANGIPHLDTYGPFAAWLMAEHGFTPADIARVCSFNPGNYINAFSSLKFGKIEKGYAGSLTVIDMKKPWAVTARDLKTKCDWSPFENITFPGSVKYTVSLGKIFPYD